MAHLQPFNLDPEPDLHPLYPSTQHIQKLLSSDSGLDSGQKAELVVHCLKRACLFADLSILQFLLSDRAAQVYVDLGIRDEDGVSLISLAIHGFGGDLDRDVEREECVRYLVSQGADLCADNGEQPSHIGGMTTHIYIQSISWLDASASCCNHCPSHFGIISHDAWMLSI
jgi:hypothetical protein